MKTYTTVMKAWQSRLPLLDQVGEAAIGEKVINGQNGGTFTYNGQLLLPAIKFTREQTYAQYSEPTPEQIAPDQITNMLLSGTIKATEDLLGTGKMTGKLEAQTEIGAGDFGLPLNFFATIDYSNITVKNGKISGGYYRVTVENGTAKILVSALK